MPTTVRQTGSLRRKCTVEVLIHQSLMVLRVFCCASTGIQGSVFRARISFREQKYQEALKSKQRSTSQQHCQGPAADGKEQRKNTASPLPPELSSFSFGNIYLLPLLICFVFHPGHSKSCYILLLHFQWRNLRNSQQRNIAGEKWEQKRLTWGCWK